MAKRRARRGPPKGSHYTDSEGNILTLRQSLSPGTIAKLQEGWGGPAASMDDAWRRRGEHLFERLAISWEIAGLPLDDQAMLLGRYRMADTETQRWVREAIDRHLREFIPELAGP
ncbi:MAG: hypothetical protein EXQ70_11040 [Solirubrobacterales bacterium]|nr:hypothetical protein [Solirubrobacterales bacterium]